MRRSERTLPEDWRFEPNGERLEVSKMLKVCGGQCSPYIDAAMRKKWQEAAESLALL